MAKIFKNEEMRDGFYRLKADYEDFCGMIQSRHSDISRLLENTFVGFEEQCWDSMMSCLEDEWVASKEAEFEEHELAGGLDGFIAVVVENDKEGEQTKN